MPPRKKKTVAQIREDLARQTRLKSDLTKLEQFEAALEKLDDSLKRAKDEKREVKGCSVGLSLLDNEGARVGITADQMKRFIKTTILHLQRDIQDAST